MAQSPRRLRLATLGAMSPFFVLFAVTIAFSATLLAGMVVGVAAVFAPVAALAAMRNHRQRRFLEREAPKFAAMHYGTRR